MVPQTPSRYYQASPAPERAPRAKNGQAAVPDIFELSGLACKSGSHASPWDPSRALVDARKKRRAYFSLQQNPALWVKSIAATRGRVRGHTHRSDRVPLRERRVFKPRLRGRRNAGLRRNSRPLAAASTAAPAPRLQSAARRPLPAQTSQLSAWKSAQELARRLRKRRAATDDGRAHQFRTASTHRRCCHR